MSPPIVPAPTTWTRWALNPSSLPSDFKRSCNPKSRIRLAAVGVLMSDGIDAGSAAGTACALGHLLARLRGDDGAHQRIQRQRQGEAKPPRRRAASEDAARRVLHDPR